jgi:exodeoxyribonuclease V alpha subunit
MVRVLFDDGKEVEYESTQLEELDLAYATTVHKSQGSEFRIVVIPVFMGSQRLMTRNLLYTAMTRAKEMLVFVGNMKCIEYMAKNLNKKERFSGLKQMIQNDKEIPF